MNEKLLGFHVSRLSRDRYQFDDAYFAYHGKAMIPSFQTARGFANRLNQRRDIAQFPDQIVLASQINAVALVHGITHYLFRLYQERHPQLLTDADEHLQEALGSAVDKTLDKFVDEFPPQPVYRREVDREGYLTAEHEARSNREVALEELLLLWLANANPAFSPFLDLFGDDLLKQQTAYPRVMSELNTYFADIAKTDPGDARFPGGANIIDILLEPVRVSPHSLEGQLRVLMERWGGVIGAYVYRLLMAMDIIKEDFRPIPGPPGGAGTTPVPSYSASDYEPENFTPDREWMPNLVMLAKNAYVWLDQLSKKHGREIMRLDQIPDEELDQLAAWGFTGLWLIGLWERSDASQRIKQLCGNPDAVASAYSLLRYDIAGRLGGDAAINNLRERAWKRGIRLASDMVPNHMGIDSNWVMEHPDWFLSLNYSPYPNYTFNGPNLSSNPGVGIYIEDHYYDRTDAAVVFKRVDHGSGDTRYIYHGNDGTSMPWNDTAQLNYLNPEVREAMIQIILNIARQFPIIRFDAAMTLVKKHVQRLWFPEPGTGGAIPSRAEHGLTRVDFDRLMPEEFWREVIDRAAVEAPDTLLLAEAFWLLEGYFVRTLGMHRVYNSAFMNMLRDEENAKYRSVIKNTLEFEPEVLRRYVNFLNNPDEKTAVEQFGKGDKYFGVCVLLLTMPGLPMFGHGQVEGFAEKYGMEYYRAYWDEQPDAWLIQRHERELFPLAKKRYLFAGVDNFLLYDFHTSGNVDENVFAYSNRVGDERALVLYNNAYTNTRGAIRMSSAFSAKSGDSRVSVQRSLGEGLNLPYDESVFCIYRDHRAGLEYIRNCRDLHDNGFYAELNAYQHIVLLDFRIVADTPLYRQLASYLGGRGVPSIDEALREIMVAPVRTPFRELVNGDLLTRLLDASEKPDEKVLTEAAQKLTVLLDAVEAFVGEAAAAPTANQKAAPTTAVRAREVRKQLEALLKLPKDNAPAPIRALVTGFSDEKLLWGSLIAWLFVRALGDAEQVRSWLDEWLLGRLIGEALREVDLEGHLAARGVTSVKLALALPEILTAQGDESPVKLIDALLQNTDAQLLLNINHFQGVVWFNQEGYDTLLRWMIFAAQLEAKPAELETRYATIQQLAQAAKGSGYQIEKLRAALAAPAAEGA